MWASWLNIGAISGFPKLGHMTTGWILPVSTEAYWGYAVWAWLAGASGPRSRKFAMWTAAGMFVLSLGGQESAHLIAAAGNRAPWYAVVLVTALPLFAVGLIAVLVHLRQADREEAGEAERRKADAARQAAIERAEADERTALRRELAAVREEMESITSTHREELGTERTAHETAQHDLAEALARAEKAEAKLAATSAQKKRAKGTRNAQGGDLTTELRAIQLLDAHPELRQPRMGAELARRLGVSPATGRRLHSQLTAENRPSEALAEEAP